MTIAFQELSAMFFAEVLSRRARQPVRVRSVRVTEHAGAPAGLRRAVGLRRADLDTSAGPLTLMVKVLAQAKHKEALVWRFLEKAGGLPLPEVYHVEYDSRRGQYGVILEYVPPAPGAERWDAHLCRLAGAALARLHARFWARDGSLPDTFEPPETASHLAVEPTARRFLDRMSPERQAVLYSAAPEVFAFMARLLRMDPSFFREGRQLPRTLIHGALDDSEVLFRRRGADLEAVLIDWEQARVGRATEDLSALISALPRQDRQEGREALVAGYLEAMRGLEIALPTAQLDRELDRQRALHAAHELPRLCAMYLERRNDPAQQAWCRWFLGVATTDAAELRQILDRLDETHARSEGT